MKVEANWSIFLSLRKVIIKLGCLFNNRILTVLPAKATPTTEFLTTLVIWHFTKIWLHKVELIVVNPCKTNIISFKPLLNMIQAVPSMIRLTTYKDSKMTLNSNNLKKAKLKNKGINLGLCRLFKLFISRMGSQVKATGLKKEQRLVR